MAVARARPSIAILGCGAVGTGLADALVESWRKNDQRGELLLWSRRSAERLRRSLAGPGRSVRVLEAPEEALGATRAVLLCLPDAVIAPLARRLARAVPARSRRLPVVLHTNGLLGSEALGSLKRKGAPVGKLHPLWAFSRDFPLLADGVFFGIEGDPRAMQAARAIIRSLKGKPLPLRKSAGPEYHAAASLLAGGLVVLFELADRLFRRAVPRLDAPDRIRVLHSLAFSSEFNVTMAGTRAALTGAIARGAEDTVRRHLRVLQRDRDALDAYRVLGRTMLELARARGSIDAETKLRIARLLRAPRRAR